MISAIGDLHLDALERHIPNSHEKIISTFNKVCAREVSLGTSAIVQLGDAFDNAYPDLVHLTAFIEALHKNNKVPIYMILGNHDFDDKRNWALRPVAFLCKIGFINGKVFRKPEVVKINGDKYLMCPHPYVVNEPPKGVKICFGHFGYQGARGDNGYVIKSGNAPLGRWVLGDYHTAQRGKNYAYPGSLTQVKFHESPDKYIIRIEDKVQTVKINPDIKLGRASINSVEDLQNLDPDTYWSINVSSGTKLPPDWSSKYPQVIRHHAEKDTSKRQRVLMQKVASENPLEGFGDYLMEQGMSKKEKSRTLELLGITDV